MKKSTKLLSSVLAVLMATSAFTSAAVVTAGAVPVENTLPRPTEEECAAIGEQKIYFQYPTDGTWGDVMNVKVNKLNKTALVYCNPYVVYGKSKEFFDPGWETKPGQCVLEGEQKDGLFSYNINSAYTVTLTETDPATGKKKKVNYFRYLEQNPDMDCGVLFSTSSNGGFQTADVSMTTDCLGDTVELTTPIQTRENAANSAKSDYFAHWKNHPELDVMANVTSTGKFVDGQFPAHQPRAQMLSSKLKDYLTNFINVGYFNDPAKNQVLCEKLGTTPKEVYDQYMADYGYLIEAGTVEPANPDDKDKENGCPVEFVRYDANKLDLTVDHKKLASPKAVQAALGLSDEEVEPTTVEPTTVEPTTAEPTTVEPTTAEPTTVEPTTAEPTTVEPTTAEPTTVEPTTAEPTTVEPTTAEPTTVEPTEPVTAEPTTVEPTTVAPTTEPAPAEDVFVLAGTTNWLSTGWNPDPDSYTMTKAEDGTYSITVPAVTAADGIYAVKVVQFIEGDAANAVWHGLDGTDLNVDFMLNEDCDVTVTFNPETGEITVTGDGVVPPVYKLDAIYAVGESGGTAFLNGESWKVDADANKMTEVSDGVYEITFEDVDTNTNYQFKFAANGNWDMNWGYGESASTAEIALDTAVESVYNGGNATFAVESEEETCNITLRLDLTNWDSAKKGGATITVITAAPEQPTTEPAPVVLWGDVDGNGKVDAVDATYIQMAAIDLPIEGATFNADVADVNGDGRISILDATCVQKFAAEFATGTGRAGQPV